MKARRGRAREDPLSQSSSPAEQTHGGNVMIIAPLFEDSFLRLVAVGIHFTALLEKARSAPLRSRPLSEIHFPCDARPDIVRA